MKKTGSMFNPGGHGLHRSSYRQSPHKSSKQFNYSLRKIKPPQQNFNFTKNKQLKPFKVQRKRAFDSFKK